MPLSKTASRMIHRTMVGMPPYTTPDHPPVVSMCRHLCLQNLIPRVGMEIGEVIIGHPLAVSEVIIGHPLAVIKATNQCQ